jgi:hypothetical protein
MARSVAHVLSEDRSLALPCFFQFDRQGQYEIQ